MDILSVLTFLLIFGKQSLVLCDEVHSNNGTDRYVSYQGFGDLVLTCNGSDVINITGFDLTNYATSCPHQSCALSDNDMLLIENCNDNSTCTIPVHNMSGCITETGFYNVEYTCKTKALTCDFDHNRCNIQGTWTVDEAHKAGKAGTSYRDHTLSKEYGRLMYIINGQSGETKNYNRVYSSPKQCLSFYYWGNGFGYLTVYRELGNGSIDNIDQFPNADWTWKIFTRNLNNIGDYYLRFEATGSGSSQFLVDDIRILNADCDESRDHIQYNETCRRVDDVTELQDCGKHYTENVISHLDPSKERCHNLLDEEHICDVSSDPIHCDARQLVTRFPSCFNLNTLMINYTCKEKLEVSVEEEAQNTNDAITIGLIAVAVSGVILICLIIFIICRYNRRQKEGTPRMQNQSVLWNSTKQDTLSQAQPNLESMNSSSLYTDTNQATSDSEHRHMSISSAYEAIIETPNDYTNNQIPGHENDNQLGDNYNILDPNSIGNPNVYDDLNSPSYTDMNNDTANECKKQCENVDNNQMLDNYTTLDPNRRNHANVYDDLASPSKTGSNTNNDTANGNEYEEPVQGENVDDNQVLDSYTTLDPNGRSNPNVYDVLVSPSNTNTNDDTVNDYEEPVPGEYTDCIVSECKYEQN